MTNFFRISSIFAIFGAIFAQKEPCRFLSDPQKIYEIFENAHDGNEVFSGQFQPPEAKVSLNKISGTMGNFYAEKFKLRQSEPGKFRVWVNGSIKLVNLINFLSRKIRRTVGS